MQVRSGLIIGLFLCIVSRLLAQPGTTPLIPIIPLPAHLQAKGGVFLLDAGTVIRIEASKNKKEVTDVATFFAHAVEHLSGYKMAVSPSGQPTAKNKTIHFRIAATEGVGEEGYTLSVTPKEIIIQANQPRGLFYGVQSLLQTLPAMRTNQLLQIPCMEVSDEPSFKWRGMMLDVSRHFFAPELVKEFIDLLATYKMNTFHWHLVDGAGWRIEIKKYPKLTSQGAWRADDFGKSWNWADIIFNKDRSKATYGGYYTQDQIRDIVAYAAARYITIVPEIEMPGHSEAAMAAYPEFSCLPHKKSFNESGDFYARDAQSNYVLVTTVPLYL